MEKKNNDATVTMIKLKDLKAGDSVVIIGGYIYG